MWYNYISTSMTKITKTSNTKCGQGCKANGTAVQDGKLFWQFQLNKQPSNDPAFPVPALYPREINTYVHKKICTRMFLKALFATAKDWKLPKYPSTGERKKTHKLWYASTVENYWALMEQTNDAPHGQVSKNASNERYLRIHWVWVHW